MKKGNMLILSLVVFILGMLSLGMLTLNNPTSTSFIVYPSNYLGNTWTLYKEYSSVPNISGAKIEYYARYVDPQQDSLIVINIVFSNTLYARQYMAQIESVTSSSVSPLYTYQEGLVQEVVLMQGNSVAEVIYVGTTIQVPTGALLGLANSILS